MKDDSILVSQEQIEEEKAKLREEFEAKINEINAQYEEEKMGKEALQKKMDSIKAQYDSQLGKLNDGKKRKSGRGQKKQHVRPVSVDMDKPPAELLDEVADNVREAQIHMEQSQEHFDPPRENSNELIDYDLNEMINDIEANVAIVPPARATDSAADTGSVDDAAQRLQQLQELVVGGEQVNNEEIKKKRANKKKYAEERKQKLAESLRNGDDDEFMLRVYDSVQEEVQYKTELYKKEKEKCKFLENECKDLQQEFEKERQLLLETIRKNEKQMKLFAKILQKVQPIVPSDSNYHNIDKIQGVSHWNEETQDWILPDFKREKLSLPSMGVGATDNSQSGAHRGRENGSFDSNMHQHHPQDYEDNYYEQPQMQRQMILHQPLLNGRRQSELAAFNQPREPEVDR